MRLIFVVDLVYGWELGMNESALSGRDGVRICENQNEHYSRVRAMRENMNIHEGGVKMVIVSVS